MTDRAAVERSLRVPPPDERGYVAPGLRPAAALGRVADPAWRAPREGPRAAALLAAAAIATALLLAGLVVAGGLTTQPEPTPSSETSAAEALGVDPAATVETADGVVAARAHGTTVELAIAEPSTGGWLVRVLASFIEPPAVEGGFTIIDVSCDSSFGIRQPNFVYGDVGGDPSRPSGTIKVSGLDGAGSSFGDGPWVVAFSAGEPIRGTPYELSVDRGPQYRDETIGGGSFDDPQACGTTKDLGQVEVASPTPAPKGSGRLLLETATTTYGPGSTAMLGRVTVSDVRLMVVFDETFTAATQRSVDLPAGTYLVHATADLHACDGSVVIRETATTAVSIEWFAGGCRVTAEPGSSGASTGVLRLSPMRIGIPEPTAGVVVAPAADGSHLFVQVVASGGGVVFDSELSESQALSLPPGDYSIRAWQALVVDNLETGGRSIGPALDPCLGTVTLKNGQTLGVTVEKQPYGAGCRVLPG